MTSARPTPLNDDSGDQFPGAVPATTAPRTERAAGDDRLVRMTAAYTEKVNAALQADRENLARELADTFLEEISGSAADGPARRPATRRASSRGHRPPTALGRLTRRSLRRFDRYTLDVFNPRPPHALYAARPDRSV